MKKYQVVVGVDVSKDHLDSYVIAGETEQHHRFDNSTTAIRSLIKHACSLLACLPSQVLVCLEHTGVYAMPLCTELSEQNLDYALLAPIELKRSLGLRRGKNDKADAKAIARYAFLHQHEIQLYRLPEKILSELKLLLAHRERLMESRKVFMVASKETGDFLDKSICKHVIKDSNAVVLQLEKKIAKTEQSMLDLIDSSDELKKLYELVSSVPGVGMQIAVSLIVITRCFTCFKDPRKLACYAGVAPFEYSSGSSIHGRSKVSHMANKKIKALLHMGALVAIKNDMQLKQYYERKKNEGKNAMSVINAVRNKLIARIFAVVNRGTPFVRLGQHAA